MKIIFDKSLGSMILVAITGKQSGQCSICGKKLTQRNLGMIYKYDDKTCLCCNNHLCFLEVRNILNEIEGSKEA